MVWNNSNLRAFLDKTPHLVYFASFHDETSHLLEAGSRKSFRKVMTVREGLDLHAGLVLAR